MFEGIKNAMKEWSEIWQPMYNDIGAWKDMQDIGHFSDKTLKEMQEVWDTVPKVAQKDLYNAYKLLIKHLDPVLIKKILKLYMTSIGNND